jgi:ADP-ribose pyrophosphatase YjhB (NUDIX family)
MKTFAPQFKNVQNRKIVSEEGEEIWVSRAVAVVVFLTCRGTVLLTVRGKKMDSAGKLCLPCGYLDYNETLEEAASRELYEECNVYVPKEFFKVYKIDSQPKSNRQNVSITFTVNAEAEKNMLEGPFLPNEEVESRFYYSPVRIGSIESDQFAFGHKEIIMDYFKSKI